MTEINNRKLSQRNTFGHKRGTKMDRGPANYMATYVSFYICLRLSNKVPQQTHKNKVL